MAKQGPISGGLLHPIAFTREHYLLPTVIRQSLLPKLDPGPPQTHTKQLWPTHPYLELLRLAFKPLLVEQLFVRRPLTTLAVLHTEGRVLLSYYAHG